ncbi:adenylate kinase [Chloroflexota bacterium]
MYIILLGAPGAGKGTQAATVAQELNLAHLATGDLYRQAVAQGTELGKKAKYYMDRGELGPDELTIDMITERMSAPDCKKGVVFDGFPRTLGQAWALDENLGRQDQEIDRAVYINVLEEELLKRLSGRWVCRQCQAPYHATSSPPRVTGKCDRCSGELYQRADDEPETIKRRLEVYFRDTVPLIDYYTRAGKLIEIDGTGKVGEVSERIISALRESLSAGNGCRMATG